MRTPVRHFALLVAGFAMAVGAVMATDPGHGPLPLTGSFPLPQPAERAGRPATPSPPPLCAGSAVRHHGDEPTTAPRPAALDVPILAYHYVRTNWAPGDDLGRRLSVTPHDFAAQMDLLHRLGAHALTLDDVVGALQGQVTLPPHPVVLTFDDGYADFFTNALPVLRSEHFCATLFAVPGFLGRPAYLTSTQLQEVAAAGVQIGAHTMDHLDLAHQPPPAVSDQVTRSRDVLRSLTGQPVDDFAYPYGTFDSAAIAAVQSAGFTAAAALAPTLPETLAARFTLPRREVIGGESLAQFAGDAGFDPARAGLQSRPWQPRPSPPAASGVSRWSSATRSE